MTTTAEECYQGQIKHLTNEISQLRRLIQALQGDYRLIQVIVGQALNPTEDIDPRLRLERQNSISPCPTNQTGYLS